MEKRGRGLPIATGICFAILAIVCLAGIILLISWGYSLEDLLEVGAVNEELLSVPAYCIVAVFAFMNKRHPALMSAPILMTVGIIWAYLAGYSFWSEYRYYDVFEYVTFPLLTILSGACLLVAMLGLIPGLREQNKVFKWFGLGFATLNLFATVKSCFANLIEGYVLGGMNLLTIFLSNAAFILLALWLLDIPGMKAAKAARPVAPAQTTMVQPTQTVQPAGRTESVTGGNINLKSNAEQLKEYKELLDAGIITQADFDAKKAEILSQPEPTAQPAQTPAPEPNAGWGVLGAFFPLVGLILFLVWNTSRPQDAKYAGIGALIGFGVSVLFGLLGGCAILSEMVYNW